MDELIIHPHALKHGLSVRQIVEAWQDPLGERRPGDDTYWVAIGFDLKGNGIELIAAQAADGSYLIFHANSPISASIQRELGLGKARRDSYANRGGSKMETNVTVLPENGLNEGLLLSNGEVLEERNIAAICEDLEKGILPGDYWSGETIVGRPLKFGEEMKQVGFKEPLNKIAAIDARAAQLGMKRSDYLRHLVDEDLARAGVA